MNDLERRYRRLLAWYPWEHRRQYEDEMAETLLAGASADQQRPGLRDTADIARTALAARVAYAVRGLADRRWADACAVAGVLGAIVVLSLRARLLTNYAAAELFGGATFLYLEPLALAPTAIWLAAVVLAFTRLRRTAAIAAWCGVAFDFGFTVYRPDYQVIQGHSIWPFLLGVIAAAALTVRNEPRRGARLLGRRRLALVALACAVGLVGSAVSMLLQAWPGSRVIDVGITVGPTDYLRLTGGAVALLLAGMAVWSLGPALRRRIFAVFVPLPALFAFSVYLSSAYRHEFTVVYMSPEPVQWLGTVAVGVAAFVVAVLSIQRREQRLHLIELGRDADRSPQRDPNATAPAA